MSTATAEPLQLLGAYRELFYSRPAWRYAFVTGGRGSGKSFHIALFLLNLTYEPGHVILFTRYTLVSAHISIIPEFRDKLARLGCEDDFEVTQSEIVNRHTGSRIVFRGIKTSSGTQTAALKSIQGVTTWVLDEAEELVDADIFDRIDLSIRHATLPNRVILVLNPAHKSHFLHERFVATRRADTLYIHTTWEDNRHNLSDSFVQLAQKTEQDNPRRYAHIFGGAWSDEAVGLLWTRAELEKCRLETGAESYARVVVGVDPAVTSNAASNETGIVVAGIDRNRRIYVLEDLSGRYSPSQWASIAIDAATRWKATIVAETNQGGDLVASVIKTMGQKASGIRVQDVRASRGKYARAEPVYALYQESRVFHVGQLPLLEQQMLSFNPTAKAIDSPDRVDALVWAVSTLAFKSSVFVV